MLTCIFLCIYIYIYRMVTWNQCMMYTVYTLIFSEGCQISIRWKPKTTQTPLPCFLTKDAWNAWNEINMYFNHLSPHKRMFASPKWRHILGFKVMKPICTIFGAPSWVARSNETVPMCPNWNFSLDKISFSILKSLQTIQKYLLPTQNLSTENVPLQPRTLGHWQPILLKVSDGGVQKMRSLRIKNNSNTNNCQRSVKCWYFFDGWRIFFHYLQSQIIRY